ncbi:HAD-superfamily hydrolase, subfamily IIA [Hydrogenobaculum sp. Y04AAS1]|uniref:HAD-IIA family hydrolase n=1 Tax=Hydrogenobaculum sp. (strain Y04AAS1) TaxID=380749 RepID=UPI00015BCB61|nr:HAD-superfamily hydrolase, subfamily IIA [Hydrogenobaculum sp. Y04AAS1]HCT66473.1 HAD-IIA family hydrolase [Hydrogenobaculum sp.]
MKILVDLDGVLVKDKEFNLFEDSKAFLSFLKTKNFKILSNNSTKPPEELVKILNEKGLNVEDKDILTPLKILPDYLKEKGISSCFVIGTDHLKAYLSKFVEVKNDIDVESVIIGQDKQLSFEKLKKAISAVFLNKAKIIPINHSKIVKDSDGLYFQGSGSLAFMIANATDYKEDIPNLGKPSELFLSKALNNDEYKDSVIISDDFYTDLIGAKALGIKTIFITTGKYKKEDLEKTDFRPDFIVSSLKETEEILLSLES